MKNIDFKSGKIVYNEYHIDFNKLLSKQLDFLTEDLLQVKYENNYLLDVGWYPEYDANGNFIIQLVKDNNWETPIFKKSCKTYDELKENLVKAIETACKK